MLYKFFIHKKQNSMNNFDTSTYIIGALIGLGIFAIIWYQIIFHAVRDANKKLIEELKKLNEK